MLRLNATITASDDNNLILETRGRQAGTRVIPRDDNAAAKLLEAVEAAFEANKPPQRPQPAAAPAKPEAPAEPAQ